MATYTNRGLRLHFRFLIISLLLVAPAWGSDIITLAGNLGGASIFDGYLDIWDIPGASMTNGTATDGTGSLFGLWNIPTATFTWTGNALSQDLSQIVGGDSLADGIFLGDGTMTITGTVKNIFGTTLYTGTLLEGTVSGFRWTEDGPASNGINLNGSDPTVRVTGGWLTTNTMGMTMPLNSMYWLDASAQGCQQDGGDLDNWQGMLVTSTDITGFALTYVPEPGTILLLWGGGMLILRRGRKLAFWA